MTREEAIRMLKYNSNVIHKTINGETDPNEVEALDMAIKALEQEPCDDCVKRQAVLNTLDEMDKALDIDRTVESYKELLTECYKNLPSVTPKEKTGHWIRQTDDYHDYYECEHCGIAVGLDDIKNYCPNCGAKMD